MSTPLTAQRLMILIGKIFQRENRLFTRTDNIKPGARDDQKSAEESIGLRFSKT